MADLVRAARVLRTAAGSGSSDPSPNYVKVDPNVMLLLANLLEAVNAACLNRDSPEWCHDSTHAKARALAAAILGGGDDE